ncbi:MAG TPA: methyltransferase domain-containing protein [Acidimicrobiales bacterium]|nr:methyltransferase domain-containing protein [Acidimicrobiales bacterium]
MPDLPFDDPRLAALYDIFDPDRSDLDVYSALAAELGARSVLDIGCGTGTFACLLARRGLDVTGVDPAAAMLVVARAKPDAERVRWLHGVAPDLPPLQVDLATMTGNVAQVFLDDRDWADTLTAAHRSLRPGGWLVFESRRPERQAWREWTRDDRHQREEIDGVGLVETWDEVTEVALPYVTFRSTMIFHADGAELTSESTLRFRSRDEIGESLAAAGFSVEDVRDAPDRPGKENVFVARKG